MIKAIKKTILEHPEKIIYLGYKHIEDIYGKDKQSRIFSNTLNDRMEYKKRIVNHVLWIINNKNRIKSYCVDCPLRDKKCNRYNRVGISADCVIKQLHDTGKVNIYGVEHEIKTLTVKDIYSLEEEVFDIVPSCAMLIHSPFPLAARSRKTGKQRLFQKLIQDIWHSKTKLATVN